jgi:hypothetical protein
MKIRLEGTKEETAALVKQWETRGLASSLIVGKVIRIKSVSKFYPNHYVEKEKGFGRVYLELES